MSTTSTDTRTGLIAWHDLVTGDRDAARRFYRELLGWDFADWGPSGDPYPLVRVGGRDHGGMVQSEDDAHWVAYVVADVDSAAERAREEGGSVVVPPTEIPEVGRFAVLADPQGGVVSPFAPSYDSPPPQGVFLWDELQTPDVEASRRFYSAVFGWGSIDMDLGEPGPYVVFTRGEEQLCGAVQKPADASGGATWVSYLASEDVDRDLQRAVQLGATLHVEPSTTPGIGRSAVLSDPGGALFGLYLPEPA